MNKQRRDEQLQQRKRHPKGTVMSERANLVFVQHEGFWKIPIPTKCAAQVIQVCHKWLCPLARVKMYGFISDRMLVNGDEDLCRKISVL